MNPLKNRDFYNPRQKEVLSKLDSIKVILGILGKGTTYVLYGFTKRWSPLFGQLLAIS